MTFVKMCLGFAACVTGTAGTISGVEGVKCRPENFQGWFGEFGAAVEGVFGVFVDFGSGSVEGGGAAVGIAVRASASYYW